MHATTAIGNNSYIYDENGNMVIRSLVSGTVTGTYTLTHNAENRLVGVSGPDSTTTYTYNGDLAQVIAIMEGSQFVTKTIYIGSYYEYQIVETLTSTVATTRTYYFAGSTRVAMRDNGTLIFLLSDHLGSTSMTTDASGRVLSVQKYMPYGEVRGVGGLETNYTYTGQRSIAALGIMNYRARHYDPALGRFLEADSIVPGAGNPMAFDRYMCVFGNPLRYVDPSGHDPICTLSLDDQCIISQDGGRRIYHLPGSGSSKNNKEPWKNDPDYVYDPLHDAILNWGDPTGSDHESRRQRSGAVWSWICQSGGWWGPGCPSAYDLTVWLLWQEVGVIFVEGAFGENEAASYIVPYIRDMLKDGIDILINLPLFTAFFNPNSGGTFNAGDWAELMTKPIALYFNIVNSYWEKPNPYPGDRIVWRTPGEVYGPGFSTLLIEVTVPSRDKPDTRIPILQVGIK